MTSQVTDANVGVNDDSFRKEGNAGAERQIKAKRKSLCPDFGLSLGVSAFSFLLPANK